MYWLKIIPIYYLTVSVLRSPWLSGVICLGSHRLHSRCHLGCNLSEAQCSSKLMWLLAESSSFRFRTEAVGSLRRRQFASLLFTFQRQHENFQSAKTELWLRWSCVRHNVIMGVRPSREVPLNFAIYYWLVCVCVFVCVYAYMFNHV